MNQTTPPDEAAEILKEFATYCAVQGTPFGSMPNDEVKFAEALAKLNRLRVRDRLAESILSLVDNVEPLPWGFIDKQKRRQLELRAQLTVRGHEHQWSTAGGYDDTSCDVCGVPRNG